jgi:hypothetical protein
MPIFSLQNLLGTSYSEALGRQLGIKLKPSLLLGSGGQWKVMEMNGFSGGWQVGWVGGMGW